MNKLLLLLLAGASPAAVPAAPIPESAQEAILPTNVVAPAPAAPATAPAASVTARKLAPVTPAANPNAIKVKAEANSATGRLTVKTDNPGPTRVELTDAGGRPVLTYTMMNGQASAVLNVSRFPAGSYIVRCTAYEKSGMRRVMIGQ